MTRSPGPGPGRRTPAYRGRRGAAGPGRGITIETPTEPLRRRAVVTVRRSDPAPAARRRRTQARYD
eukprot:143437-Hanusia_phi.AAC.1